MGVLEKLSDYYNRNDPRTSELLLVSRPGTIIALVTFYFYFCVSLGPRLMKNKQPYSLREILIVYNFLQVLLSLYIVHEALMSGWLYEYNYTCQPVDYSNSTSGVRMAKGTHVYFLSKITELLDTIFFVLRKKYGHITKLHLYHHGSMPLIAWYAARYVPGGHTTFLGLNNCIVHAVMYTYYMLAAFGPKMQKYLWWKKYVTLLQIVQFALVGTHSAQMLFTDCDYSKLTSLFIVIESVAFFYMFGTLYLKQNVKKNFALSKSDSVSTEFPAGQKSD